MCIRDSTGTAVTGTVATDGSTSMEKVIGALSESFMANNADTTVTYNPCLLYTSRCV